MSTAVSNSAAASAVISTLRDRGVTEAVISPGSRSTPLVLAATAVLARTSVVLDERSAGFVALGLCRASGRPTALICSSGSALSHYFPALIEARACALPLIVLSADRPAELHDCGAWQTIEQRGLFGVHARRSDHLPAPTGAVEARSLEVDQARRTAAALLDAALGDGDPSRRGPVHLNLAFREPLWDPAQAREIEAALRGAAQTQAGPGASTESTSSEGAGLSEGELTELTDWLAPDGAARPGVIVVGLRSRRREELAESVAAVASALGWPVLAEATSGLRFGASTELPLVTRYDTLLRNPAFAAAQRPERVLQLGRTPCSKPLMTWLGLVGPGGLRQLDEGDGRQDPNGVCGRLYRRDPVGFLRELARALEERRPAAADPSRLAVWQAADQLADCARQGLCLEGELVEPVVVDALIRALPEEASLHVASSLAVRDVDAYAPDRPGRFRITANRGANGIDGTIATAAGIALARPDRRAVVLLGDLAFLHDLGSLVTARGLGVHLTLVVVDNDGGGIFETLPIARHEDLFERCFLTPPPLRPMRAAEGLIDHAVEAEDREALETALAETLPRPGLSLIVARVDRAASRRRRGRLNERLAEALGGLATGARS